MKFIASITALFAVAAVAQAQVPFTNCATGATDLTINSFTLSPYPLCINSTTCATGTGQLNAPVTAGATLSITGSYLGVNVYSDTQDLCALMAAKGYNCPIPVTLTSITYCLFIKDTAPANVPVSLTIEATNGDGNVLFCQAATVTAQNC
ncbi:hypothetical protein EDD21DRAFT_446996 [Dissophora ornata]|nr:hypothetical protein BGZ58_006843 [Dissophora ornata]KAI8597468.1 hypothetical protein EDD21DRAFT_446996 [Dissophora ornata]